MKAYNILFNFQGEPHVCMTIARDFDGAVANWQRNYGCSATELLSVSQVLPHADGLSEIHAIKCDFQSHPESKVGIRPHPAFLPCSQ